MPSALLLGVATAVCSLIPFVGTMLVWLPAAIYLMATGHLWKGIILIIWGSVVVGTIDNIIRPLVIGSRVELHPLLLLFSLLGGLQVFGFIGIFIGPVVISVIAALITLLREELPRHRISHQPRLEVCEDPSAHRLGRPSLPIDSDMTCVNEKEKSPEHYRPGPKFPTWHLAANAAANQTSQADEACP